MSAIAILGLIIRYGLPLAIRLGWASEAEAKLVLAWYWAKKNVKTTPDYQETPGQKAAQSLAPGTTNTNLTVGGYHDRGPP